MRTEPDTNTCERLCEEGEFIDENKKCVSCEETYFGCEICDIEECLECEEDPIWSNFRGVCTKCKPGQLIIDGLCVEFDCRSIRAHINERYSGCIYRCWSNCRYYCFPA